MNLPRRSSNSVNESTPAPTTPTWESIALQVRFSPSELAKKLGVSQRTVQRFFKKHYGTTVKEWMRSVRLREAHSRLQVATCVKEVAFDLGYKRASHFSRDFKNYYGVSPVNLCPASRPRANTVFAFPSANGAQLSLFV